MQYLHWFRRYLSLKNVENMQMWRPMTSLVNPILHKVYKYSSLGQFAAETIENW